MQTWLDNYIDRIINSWDWLIGPEGPVRKINGPRIADDIAAFAGTKKGITYSNQLDIVRRLAYRLTIQASDPAFIKRWDRSETAGTVRRDGDTA